MAFQLPELTYDYGALEPYISAEIMELHHSKHHQTYIDKLNTALEQAPNFQDKSIEDVLTHLDELPESIRTAVRNNGGGHYNHSLFWKTLSPQGGRRPEGSLLKDLEEKYGNFEAFQEDFNTAAAGVFGSGWAWVLPNLSITTSPNQDSPLIESGTVPLFGLDVWEHAYYLDYKNKRPDYIAAWWSVVNWREVEDRYDTTLDS